MLAISGCGNTSGSPKSASTSGAAATAGSTRSTGSPITLGYLTSESGPSSSSYFGSEGGAQAAISAQNAKGGISGHQIKLVTVDDQSTPTGNLTGAQDLVSKGVFGVIEASNVDFGSATYLQQHGIPVTGDCCQDAPWGTDSNMFSQFGGENPADSSSVDYTIYNQFYKSIGVSKVAGFAYSIAPSSQKDIKQLKTTLAAGGIDMSYENLSLPLGTNDFTGYALAMKRAGVQGGVCACVESTNLAMITAARLAGIDFKGAISQAGADSTIFGDPGTVSALQGTYWPTFTTPLDHNTPATTTFVSNLKKYDSSYKGGYPSYGTTVSYLGADFMMYGLQLAGANPSRSGFISKMHQVASYTDGGLLPAAIGWNHPGRLAPTTCQYFTKVVGTNFVTINGGKPFCGPLLPAYKSQSTASGQ